MGTETVKSGGISGWIKAGASSVFGLLSGAALMYVTPLVNNVVKPPEPVANFGFQAQGLAVTFQNRSTNATDGWWDFGDGSALEQFAPKQDTIAHSFAKPGPYVVKLSLTNLFNEKAERSVTVNVDNTNTAAPVIEQFDAIPQSPAMTAPAVFRLVAKVKNADMLVWTFEGSKPIEVSTETAGVQERWVTVNDPGYYTFRLAAAAGKQTIEKATAPQFVSPAQNGNPPMAMVTVTYPGAIRVDRKENVPFNVMLAWNPNCKDTLCPVAAERMALPGYRIVKAEISGNVKDALLRGVPTVEIAPDGGKVMVKGELVRPSNLLVHLHVVPRFHVPIKVTMEKRSGATPQTFELPMCVNVPGQTKIPLPALAGTWQATKRQVALNLKEGDRAVWSGTIMPNHQPVQLKGRPVFVSGTLQDNQVVLTVTDAQVGLPRTGN
jgi:PKD repeat protein